MIVLGNLFLELKSTKLSTLVLLQTGISASTLQKQNVVSRVERSFVPTPQKLRRFRTRLRKSFTKSWLAGFPSLLRSIQRTFLGEDTQSLSHTQPGLIERRLNENFLNYNLLLTLETQIHTHTLTRWCKNYIQNSFFVALFFILLSPEGINTADKFLHYGARRGPVVDVGVVRYGRTESVPKLPAYLIAGCVPELGDSRNRDWAEFFEDNLQGFLGLKKGNFWMDYIQIYDLWG